MAIVLRNTKSTALTFNELDGNFSDLDGRTTTIEGAYVKTVNSVSATANAITLTTTNIAEGTNLYYTDTRARAAISVTGGNAAYDASTGVITLSDAEIRDAISVTDAGGDGSLAYNSTTGVLTYTGPSLAEVQTRINNISITQLSDVLTTTLNSPTNGHGLVYNSGSGKIELAELPGAAGGEANQATSLQVANGKDVFAGKAGVEFQFRQLTQGDNIVLTQSSNGISIASATAPEFGNLKLNSAANTIENISTNANIILKPNGTGVVQTVGSIVPSADSTFDLGTNTVRWTNVYADTLNGSITGAQTGITSLLNTSMVIGRDADNQIKFSTDNKIIMRVNGADKLTLLNGTLTPETDSDLDIGTNTVRFKNLYVDAAIMDEVTISGNNITTNSTNANLVLLASGTGVVELDSNMDMNSNKIVNVTDPTNAQEAATKAYVDSSISSLNADKIIEGDTSVETIDSGTGSIVMKVDNVAELTLVSATATFGTNIVVPDGANIGSASDTDALSIGADGDITLTQDLELQHDGAELTFGANNEIKLIHNHDKGLILKHTATGDDKPITLTLQTGESDIAASDVIGKIEFQAPDEVTGSGDALLVAAAIQAVSEGDFSASSNATTLEFHTGASEAATSKMSLSSAGLLTIADDFVIKDAGTIGSASDPDAIAIGADGDVTLTQDLELQHDGATISFGADNDVVLTHVADAGLTLSVPATADNSFPILNFSAGDNDIALNDVLGQIDFQAPAEGTGSGDAILVAAGIAAVSEGDFAADNNATKLSFRTAASAAAAETASLSSIGDFTVAGDIVISDGGLIGSASDLDAISIAANGVVTFSQAITGQASSALYADLAEKYTTDAEYSPGTVVSVGGDAEMTRATSEDDYIAGVISTQPAFLMNNAIDGQDIALVGRVPVRVVGTVSKGQPVFVANNGCASATGQGKIVGIALETNSDLGESLVECMLKV